MVVSFGLLGLLVILGLGLVVAVMLFWRKPDE